MGIITREGTAPISDGEVGAAADVENEFAKLFTLVNGNLDTANIAAAAGILGTQLANTTVTGSKIAADTITKSNVAATVLAQFGRQVADNTSALTSSTTIGNVPGVGTITLTPSSTSDMVVIELTVSYGANLGVASSHIWGATISGVGDVLFGTSSNDGDSSRPMTWSFRHVVTAAAASSTVYTARYKASSGGLGAALWDETSGVDSNTIFTVTIYPVK